MAFSRKKKDSEGEPAAKEPRAPKPPKEKAAKEKKPRAAAATRGGSSKRFVLILGDEGGILVFMQGSKVLRRLFAPSAQPSHVEAMHELMQSNPKVPIFLLADVLDQQYVPQTFPPVSAMSLGGLVKRRMDRDFQTDDMKGALPLGRDKAGRKEWKFLLVAIAKTPLMAEWLDMLLELPNEFKGVYLAPVETVNYVAMLNKRLGDEKPRPWQLFISHNKVSGFRQVVMHDGKLVVTRVSQAIDEAIPAVISGNIEQEIINTVEYLKRLGFQDNAELEATVVVSQDVIDSLDLKRFGFGHTRALSPFQVAETLKFDQAALTADRFGDVVMAVAFGVSKKPVLRFANAYIEKLAKVYKTHIGIRAGAALMSLLFLGLAASTALDIVGYYASIGEAKTKSVSMKMDLDKMQAAVNDLNKDVAFKAAVVATYDAYFKDLPAPEDFARILATFVTPKHRVSSFEWIYNDPSIKKSASSPSPAGMAALPLEVKVQFDFSGTGTNPEDLNKAAGELLDAMKLKLPQYEITNDPYLWNKDDKKDEAVAVDIIQASTLTPADMIATYKLKGLKKAEGAAPPPAAAAQLRGMP